MPVNSSSVGTHQVGCAEAEYHSQKSCSAKPVLGQLVVGGDCQPPDPGNDESYLSKTVADKSGASRPNAGAFRAREQQKKNEKEGETMKPDGG